MKIIDSHLHLPVREKDIEYLQKILEKTHFDLYRNISQEIFKSSIQKTVKAKSEFFEIAIQQSLALLGDAHTRVYNILSHDYLPLETREIGGSYYIIGSSDKYSYMLGQKIEEINGYKLENIIKKVSKLSSKENNEVLIKDNATNITSNRVLRYYNFSSGRLVKIKTVRGTYNIEACDSETVHVLRPLSWTKEDLHDPTFHGNDIYKFRIVNNTLLFQYSKCSNYGNSQKELKFFKRKLLEQISSVKSIVVDLRENSGGNTSIMEDLFREFPSDKKLFVAIGRNTFSSAIHHLLYLKNNKRAILVGENAGQRPNRFGDSKEIILPNSKIRILCSFKYFKLLPEDNIDIIKPDIKIPVKIDQYINNTDPLNEWINVNL